MASRLTNLLRGGGRGRLLKREREFRTPEEVRCRAMAFDCNSQVISARLESGIGEGNSLFSTKQIVETLLSDAAT